MKIKKKREWELYTRKGKSLDNIQLPPQIKEGGGWGNTHLFCVRTGHASPLHHFRPTNTRLSWTYYLYIDNLVSIESEVDGS